MADNQKIEYVQGYRVGENLFSDLNDASRFANRGNRGSGAGCLGFLLGLCVMGFTILLLASYATA